MFDSTQAPALVADPKDAADAAGLRYVSGAQPGITRRKAGKGFSYWMPDGKRVSDTRTLMRIKAIVIPPAWTEVWICPRADGHVQATGRDARGRKQYKYHALFREMRETGKYEHMVAFARALPGIREKAHAHMALRGLPREKMLATVVHLLETTLIRVGNDDYARNNKSYGLTTLKNRHVEVNGSDVRFRFTGKSGKQWSLKVKDRRIAKIIRQCQELPGQELLEYVGEDGKPHDVTSGDVNEYLREMSGFEATAKDFRTWAGTVLAVMALREFEAFDSAAQAKRNLRQAIERVAARLGNTPTICRKCYVHPGIIDCYMDGRLAERIKSAIESELNKDIAGLEPVEAAVLAMLRTPLERNARRPGRRGGEGS